MICSKQVNIRFFFILFLALAPIHPWLGHRLGFEAYPRQKPDHARHGLFFAQLSLEKMLKAHVCQQTKDLAPRIHNLVRLAEIDDLKLTADQIDILAEMNAFNIEGRYPDALVPVLSLDEAIIYIRRAEEIYLWLKNQLS